MSWLIFFLLFWLSGEIIYEETWSKLKQKMTRDQRLCGSRDEKESVEFLFLSLDPEQSCKDRMCHLKFALWTGKKLVIEIFAPLLLSVQLSDTLPEMVITGVGLVHSHLSSINIWAYTKSHRSLHVVYSRRSVMAQCCSTSELKWKLVCPTFTFSKTSYQLRSSFLCKGFKSLYFDEFHLQSFTARNSSLSLNRMRQID